MVAFMEHGNNSSEKVEVKMALMMMESQEFMFFADKFCLACICFSPEDMRVELCFSENSTIGQPYIESATISLVLSLIAYRH